ncbi:MAG: 50S ribosomal protein L18 [Candidatus Omnitrophota bacterium]
MKNKHAARIKRHRRVRKKIFGTSDRPRICIFRSVKHIYAQAVSDLDGTTLAAASSLVSELPPVEGEIAGKKKIAKAVGKLIAQRLMDKGVTKVIFDRGGYLYHGRVAALAEGAREGGLEF